MSDAAMRFNDFVATLPDVASLSRRVELQARKEARRAGGRPGVMDSSAGRIRMAALVVKYEAARGEPLDLPADAWPIAIAQLDGADFTGSGPTWRALCAAGLALPPPTSPGRKAKADPATDA